MNTQPVPAALRQGAVLLRPDNIVPVTRTPWGGQVLGERYKPAVVPDSRGRRIGEIWEFSCDPEFPSQLLQAGAGASDLAALTAAHTAAILSPARVARGERHIDLLIKLLDTDAPLSLQVHPADGDVGLKASESGKPESWLILAAKPGAGIYLGFAKPTAPALLREAIVGGGDVDALLQFVPVAPGDFFDIAPGVPHVIGGGVTLLEAQRVPSGKSGKTYRLWDWNRRYDGAGALDTRGQPRELHLDAGLRLVDPERQVGLPFVSGLKREPKVRRNAGVEAREFPANAHYQLVHFRLDAASSLQLAVEDGYGALIVLGGELATVGGQRLAAGQPALLPHAALPLTFTASTPSELAVVVPAGSRLVY